MYNTGVPEKIISGHESLKALRAYERTSTEQQKTAGESIHSGKLFTPVTEKENCENFSMIKCASFEPDSATANEDKPGPVSRESLKTLQQFSGLQGCTFNFFQSN